MIAISWNRLYGVVGADLTVTGLGLGEATRVGEGRLLPREEDWGVLLIEDSFLVGVEEEVEEL